MRFRIRTRWWQSFKRWLYDHLPHWPGGWFAWCPVKLDNGEWAWLERVERDVKTTFYDYPNMFGGKSWSFYTTVTYRPLD